ncbi:MAG TPA: hypothetical protein VHA78_02300 [Candidatus Peribacteraceae bacterium]|nr:hypothetical protein [Candidatus Peribacteraceae bacterium]
MIQPSREQPDNVDTFTGVPADGTFSMRISSEGVHIESPQSSQQNDAIRRTCRSILSLTKDALAKVICELLGGDASTISEQEFVELEMQTGMKAAARMLEQKVAISLNEASILIEEKARETLSTYLKSRKTA